MESTSKRSKEVLPNQVAAVLSQEASEVNGSSKIAAVHYNSVWDRALVGMVVEFIGSAWFYGVQLWLWWYLCPMVILQVTDTDAASIFASNFSVAWATMVIATGSAIAYFTAVTILPGLMLEPQWVIADALFGPNIQACTRREVFELEQKEIPSRVGSMVSKVNGEEQTFLSSATLNEVNNKYIVPDTVFNNSSVRHARLFTDLELISFYRLRTGQASVTWADRCAVLLRLVGMASGILCTISLFWAFDGFSSLPVAQGFAVPPPDNYRSMGAEGMGTFLFGIGVYLLNAHGASFLHIGAYGNKDYLGRVKPALILSGLQFLRIAVFRSLSGAQFNPFRTLMPGLWSASMPLPDSDYAWWYVGSVLISAALVALFARVYRSIISFDSVKPASLKPKRGGKQWTHNLPSFAGLPFTDNTSTLLLDAIANRVIEKGKKDEAQVEGEGEASA